MREGEDMVLHTYECIESKIPLDIVWMLGKLFLTFFPKAQPLQTVSCTKSKLGIPFTIRCKPKEFSEVNVPRYPMKNIIWDDSIKCHGCNILS